MLNAAHPGLFCMMLLGIVIEFTCGSFLDKRGTWMFACLVISAETFRAFLERGSAEDS
jgi:hypothetical protein